MSFGSLLDSTCTIRRQVPGTPDGMGGHTGSSWVIVYKRVRCRFESLQKEPTMVMAYDKQEVYPDYYVYLKYRSAIKEGQRIYFKGREFEIKLKENWSERSKYLQLAVVETTRTQ